MTLSSDPRSGRAWLQAIIEGMLRHACSEDACCKLVQTKSATTLNSPIGSARVISDRARIPIKGMEQAPVEEQPPPLSDLEVDTKAAEVVRKFGRTNGFLSGHWLTILRDPRAVLVSMCEHRRIPDCDNYAMQRIFAMVGWTNLRHRLFQSVIRLSNGTRASIIFYEQLQTDFLGQVLTLSSFIFNSPLPASLINAVQRGIPPSPSPQNATACAFQSRLRPATFSMITRVMRKALGPELNKVWSC